MTATSPLERLIVEGRFLTGAESGRRYILRGVNRSGMEYRASSCGGITEAEISTLILNYGCRILRVPFQQRWALDHDHYRAQLRQVAAWANRLGAYVLFDLQWIDDQPHGPGDNRVPALPDLDTPRLWQMMAREFGQEPGVLFDLFNEPHDRLSGDPHPLLRPDGTPYTGQSRVTGSMWREWSLHLIDGIRAVAPQTVLFVSGIDWGYDLTPFPLDRPNLVYSTHVYRARGPDWEQAFGRLAATHCVFAGEWGGEARDLAWGTRLADYLDELEIGWTAWSCTDHPRLFAAHGPTPFGKIVLDRLTV